MGDNKTNFARLNSAKSKKHREYSNPVNFKQDPYTIYVDDREPKSLYEEFVFQTTTNEKFEKFKIVRRRLPTADIIFRSLAAERKEIQDFIASLYDGRLTGQIYTMSLNFTYNQLLISGNPEDLEYNETKLTMLKRILGYIYNGTAKKDIIKLMKSLIRSLLEEKPSPKIKSIFSKIADTENRYRGYMTIRFCINDKYLVHYFLMSCYKSLKVLKPVAGLKRPKAWIKDESLKVLHSIKGIGKKYIKALLIKFGSVVNIGLAKPAELATVYGIGEKLSIHINKVLNKKYTQKDFEEK